MIEKGSGIVSFRFDYKYSLTVSNADCDDIAAFAAVEFSPGFPALSFLFAARRPDATVLPVQLREDLASEAITELEAVMGDLREIIALIEREKARL